MNANITEKWESEIVTPLKELDEVHSFTVARTISEKKCVELHYHSGSAWIEIETKTAPDTWEGTFREVRWNPRRMNEHKIMSRLENIFEREFCTELLGKAKIRKEYRANEDMSR